MWQIARQKQQFLSSSFYKIQRSYEKIMCICYFIGSVVKIAYIYIFFTLKMKDFEKLKRNMSDFSDVFTYCLNLKNFASLFFLIQDNFMF